MIRPAFRPGLGAAYYSDSPPDAKTLAMLAARGEAVEYIERPEPSNSGSPPDAPTYDYNFPDTLEDCGFMDTECVMRRVAAVSAYQSGYSVQNAEYYLAQGLRDWEANKVRYEALGLPVPPKPTLEFYLRANAGSDYTPPAPSSPAPAATSQPRLTFTNLTGGNPAELRPGDRWKVEITGAPPNAAVSVTGGKDGARDTTGMGNTDSAGNFTLTGTITADLVGAWSETWTAGGINAGSVSFLVRAAAAQGTGGGGSEDEDEKTPPASAGFNLNSLPWYAWAGGAALLIFASRGGGRR